MPSILSVAIGSFVGLWLGMGVLCSPILVSSSCRRLFDSGPFDHLAFNYLGGMGVFTFIHVVLIFAGALVNYVVRVQISWWFLGVTLVLAAGGWIIGSFVVPQYGWWQPTEFGLDGRIVLAVMAIWYVVCTLILAALFAFAWFLAYYPG